MGDHNLKGGAWLWRDAESDSGWQWPAFIPTPWSHVFVIELFHRRLVVSWWGRKQLTPEELEREDDSRERWHECQKQAEAEREYRESRNRIDKEDPRHD